MASLLAEKRNVFWRDYALVVAAGASTGIGLNALPPVRKAIGGGFDTKTITLSCGKLTNGLSSDMTTLPKNLTSRTGGHDFRRVQANPRDLALLLSASPWFNRPGAR